MDTYLAQLTILGFFVAGAVGGPYLIHQKADYESCLKMCEKIKEKPTFWNARKLLKKYQI